MKFIDTLDAHLPEKNRNARLRLSRDELEARLKFYESHTPGFEATGEHLDALEAIFTEHRNVLITGGAGTGKTTFVKHVVMPELDFRNLHWSVTATTGLAGSHLNGRTVNSFFGIGLGPRWTDYYPANAVKFIEGAVAGESVLAPQDMSASELESWYEMFFDAWMNDRNISHAVRNGVIKRLTGHEVVILDEVSMAGGNALIGYLDYILKQLRGIDKPFGGIQMVFVGDFAQLPPVDARNDASRADWAFMSPCWTKGRVKAIELTRPFRQGDPEFLRFLNNIRVGKATEEDREFARRHVAVSMSQEEALLYPALVPTNEEARRINLSALDAYDPPTYPLEAEFHIAPGVQTMREWEIQNIDRLKEDLVKNLRLVEKTIFVRVGTPVMFTMNDPGSQFVNGTRGFVEEVNFRPRDQAHPEDDDSVVIRVPAFGERPEKRVVLRRWGFTKDRDQNPTDMTEVPANYNADSGQLLPAVISKFPTIRQFPLIPATAITIHKSQGMSLDRAILSLSRTFAAGQVYVGLSRLRSPDGLVLTSPDFSVLVDPLVMDFYRSIREQNEIPNVPL